MKTEPFLKIRKAASPSDWSFIRETCALTGNSGEPIDRDRWPFFSEYWVGPYEKLEPSSAYLACDGDAPVGYLTGCPNTETFEFRKCILFSLPLFLRTRFGSTYSKNSDVERFEKRFLGREKSPEETYPIEVRERLLREYPAHLHINLRSNARGLGAGRRLVEAFSQDLKIRNVPGIHVHCGEKPVGFYLKIGFQEIAKIEFRPGVWVYALGLRL